MDRGLVVKVFKAACVKNPSIAKRMLEGMTYFNRENLMMYRNDLGMTLLHELVKDGRIDIVQCYVSHIGQLEEVTRDGETALFLAASLGFDSIVDILLALGANPHKCNNDKISPMFMACFRGHIAVVEIFMSIDINPFKSYYQGVSAPMHAFDRGHFRVHSLCSDRIRYKKQNDLIVDEEEFETFDPRIKRIRR